ncbi:hypothetical protein Tco_0397849 [Tanacetum coccineum]
MVVQNQSELGEGLAILTDPHHTPTIIQPSTQPQKTQKPRKPKRKDTQVPQPSYPSENVVDKAVYKELGDSLVRAATITSSLESEQDNGGGIGCQETMRDTIARTRLVPSCFVIFDLEPLSLSLVPRSLNLFLVCLDRLFHLAILCLDQHAHTLNHLESLLTISLDRLDILKKILYIRFEHEHVIQRISLSGFPDQSVGSFNTDVLDLPCLLVLITGTSESRQHGKSESDSYYLSD